MAPPVLALKGPKDGFLPSGKPLVFQLLRGAAARADAGIKLTVTYLKPTYDGCGDPFDVADTSQVELAITDDPAGGPGRVLSMEPEVAGPPDRRDARPAAISLRLGSAPAVEVPIYPKERERVSLTVEAVNINLRFPGKKAGEDAYRVEIGERWVRPETKIQEILEWQYLCDYAPAMAPTGGTNDLQIKAVPDWDRHEKPPKKRPRAVIFSRSGEYRPGLVCISFVNYALVYWFGYFPKAWGLAGVSKLVFKRFRPFTKAAPVRTTWTKMLKQLGPKPSADSSIYVCATDGHIWLLVPLGKRYKVSKRYIFGRGKAEDPPPPAGWHDESCAPGWYKIHASGEAVGLTHSIFEQRSAEHFEKLGGLVDSQRERRDAVDPKFLKHDYKVFAGTPLTLQNARVFLDGEKPMAALRELPAPLTPEKGDVVSLSSRKFQFVEIRHDALDPVTGWAITDTLKDKQAARVRDVRPLIIDKMPEKKKKKKSGKKKGSTP